MAKTERFAFIDHLRGLVVVLMALDHASYYYNSAWLTLDSLDPFFDSASQFWVRFMPYFCAPGFLLIAGAMVQFAWQRRVEKIGRRWPADWHIIQRGLFLILLQLTWVNSSWGGFTRLRMGHYGIIACIGTALILLLLSTAWNWKLRAALASAIFLVHPLLLRIPYDYDGPSHYVMQGFIDSGTFNKYPVLPWFGMALVGSVMAHFWFKAWPIEKRDTRSMLLGLALILVGGAIRLAGGYGNIFLYGDDPAWSFLMVQKYPPSLVHQLWFAGSIVFLAGALGRIATYARPLLHPLEVYGKVPLFFYGMHIALLGVFAKRFDLFYREGAVGATLLGWFILLLVMYPLCRWFAGVKARTGNRFVKMI